MTGVREQRGRSGEVVVVWGNCQARPLADLLTAPLGDLGLRVVQVPPVFEVGVAELAEVRRLVAQAAVLVSQPVSDTYSVPGCGTEQLAQLLPSTGRLVTVPVLYDVSAFPFHVSGHDGQGVRIDAPITDYHDLRLLAAAAAGRTSREVVAAPEVATADAFRAVAAESRAELRRRDAALDVRAGGRISAAGDMWTINHPSNAVLAAVADDIAALFGASRRISAPTREYLGQRRAPVEAAVADALGWTGATTTVDWVVDGIPLPWAQLASVHLDWYAEHPDVATETLRRNRRRAGLLGLTVP